MTCCPCSRRSSRRRRIFLTPGSMSWIRLPVGRSWVIPQEMILAVRRRSCCLIRGGATKPPRGRNPSSLHFFHRIGSPKTIPYSVPSSFFALSCPTNPVSQYRDHAAGAKVLVDELGGPSASHSFLPPLFYGARIHRANPGAIILARYNSLDENLKGSHAFAISRWLCGLKWLPQNSFG
jgi:hypothetical protein